MSVGLYPSEQLYPSENLYPSDTATTPSPLPGFVEVQVGHRWDVFVRATDFTYSAVLKIVSINVLLKHVDVDTASVSVQYTADAWDASAPGTGIALFRDGVQQFEGPITARQLDWDATQGRPQITFECVSDKQDLADRIVFPDPLRRADDQTVNDYWTRSGLPASTVMWQMISDQAGPTCFPDRQASGLVMGADPGVGAVRSYQFRNDNLMTALAQVSAVSGADLGLRTNVLGGRKVIDIVTPRDLSSSVKFAADMRNLVQITYRETAPTATDGVVGGAGALHTRVQGYVKTASAMALSWGRRIFSYIDSPSATDGTQLAQQAQDTLDQGPPTVSLTVVLTDSQAAIYGKDWGLGDRVTVFVGLPGDRQVGTVIDVIRQIAITVDNAGKEVIQPAIGSYDAKAILPTPTQQRLQAAGQAISTTTRRR